MSVGSAGGTNTCAAILSRVRVHAGTESISVLLHAWLGCTTSSSSRMEWMRSNTACRRSCFSCKLVGRGQQKAN